MTTQAVSQNRYPSKIKLFFALSRTPHGVIDMATPAFGALLCLGHLPSPEVIVIGMITAFAGYTAVYALNDLIDYRTDREKICRGGCRPTDNYLDAVLIRHPMAHGLLTPAEGTAWVLFWSLVTVIGAYFLNPVCILIFLSGCILEAAYCMMLKVSHLRTVVSGCVKTIGAIAAVFAVDPSPSVPFLINLFVFLFFWEIGGQNIPADWTDIQEDRSLDAKTIPVRFGTVRANVLVIGTLVVSVVLNTFLLLVSPIDFGFVPMVLSLFMGVYLLLIPAARLYESQSRNDAMDLFNQASYYPLSLLAIVLIGII